MKREGNIPEHQLSRCARSSQNMLRHTKANKLNAVDEKFSLRRSNRTSSTACRFLLTDSIIIIWEAHLVAPVEGREEGTSGGGDYDTHRVMKER